MADRLLALLFLLWASVTSTSADCGGATSSDFNSFRVTSDGIIEFCFFGWQPVCFSSNWTEAESTVACREVGVCGEDDVCESSVVPVLAPAGVRDKGLSCEGDESTLGECTSFEALGEAVNCKKDDNDQHLMVKVECQELSNPCPSGWVHLGETGKCYKFINEEMNWFMAYKKCLLEVRGNSNLWMMNSNSELEFIRSNVMTDYAQYTTFWTAGNDISRNNWWKNVPDDKRAGFLSRGQRFGWAENEPSDMDDALFERCAALIADPVPARNYYIHDENCGVLGIPICELDF